MQFAKTDDLNQDSFLAPKQPCISCTKILKGLIRFGGDKHILHQLAKRPSYLRQSHQFVITISEYDDILRNAQNIGQGQWSGVFA